MSEPKKKERSRSRSHLPPRRGIGAWYGTLLVGTVGGLFWLADDAKTPLALSPLEGLVTGKRAIEVESSLRAPESLGRFLDGQASGRPLLVRDSVLRVIFDWFGRAEQADPLVIKRLGEYEGPHWHVSFDGQNWAIALRELQRMFDANPIGAYRLERARPGARPIEHVEFTLLCSPLAHGLPAGADDQLGLSSGGAWRLHREPLALVSGPRAGERSVDSIQFSRARLSPRPGQLVFFLRHALVAGSLALPLGPGMQLVLPAWNGDRAPHLVVESSEQRTYTLAMTPKQATEVPHALLVCVEIQDVLGALVPVSLRVALDGRYYEWKEPLPARLPQLPRSYVPELRNYGASRFVVTDFEIAQITAD